MSLIKLLSMGHLSAIERSSFTFGIEGVSRVLLAQLTRHRIASHSIKSHRFIDESDFLYIVPETIKNLGNEEVERFNQDMCTIVKMNIK